MNVNLFYSIEVKSKQILDFQQDEDCNALVVFIYFIKYRVYLIELFYLCDLLMFI